MSPNDLIEVYLLASGKSERMGVSKPMLDFGGLTILARMVSVFREASLKRIRVIGRNDDFDLARQTLDLGLRYIINMEPNRGMAGSILEALDDCRSRWLVVCPCDLPLLRASTISSCINCIGASFDAVQPVCEGRRKHPVFLNAGSTLSLRHVLNSNGTLRDYLAFASVRLVPVDDCEQFADVDTPEDYVRLLAKAGCAPNIDTD